ncbi:extensin family protein [Methylopila sp. 73B]|uniref:extensin family protein n=1 Tax=Methylopila sp. 73B TaxID=1120792 RepID=UPI00036D4BE4|nr:extensin family protein [Methylopila sp. 73B]
MKRFGRSCLLVASAAVALSTLPAAPQASAAPRNNGSVFSDFRLPWAQQRKPVRRAKREKPATAPARARTATPVPKPAPGRAPEQERSPPPPPAAVAAAPVIAPLAAAAFPSDAEATESAARVADFVAIRLAPTPEAPPLSPLPDPVAHGRRDVTEVALPEGRPAPGVPLPPERTPEPTVVAMIPRAPLDGPPLPALPDADTPPPVAAPSSDARAKDADCAALEREGAISKPLPPILGPLSCGAPLPVELSGVTLKDGSTVAIKPAAILRCETARAVTAYVRDDLAPAAEKAGPKLTEVRTASSFVCRGRNNRRNAKMSEHGLANAVDVSGFGFADGQERDVYDETLPAPFAAAVRGSACARFMTVLGPGSDGFHEDHLHLDLRKRKNRGGRLCSWRGG